MQSMMKALGCVAGVALIAQLSYAQDPAAEAAKSATSTGTASKTFLLGASYGEDSIYALNGGASLPVGAASTFSVSLAYHHSPQEIADLTTYRGDVGFDHDFDPVGVSVGYEYWGDRDFIDTRTTRGSVYAHSELGRIALLAEYRDINLNFDVPAAARGFIADSKSVQSTGFGVSARYTGAAFDVYASGMNYDYNVQFNRLSALIDLSRVPPALRPAIIQRLNTLVVQLQRLNASSLTLANSFMSYSIAAGVDIRFGERALNVELTHDKAFTDDAILNGGSIGFLHPLGGTSDIEYRVGVSNDDLFGSSVYGGVTIYWYR